MKTNEVISGHWVFGDSPSMHDELAWKEGEGDRSLFHWQAEHQRFFERIGEFSPDMEIVVIEFKVIENIVKNISS
ncbi:ASCH domain-containing protein [Xenorhabdus taiwanensis]